MHRKVSLVNTGSIAFDNRISCLVNTWLVNMALLTGVLVT
jgi:hypothetical protein